MTNQKGRSRVFRILLYIAGALGLVAALTVALFHQDGPEVIITPQQLNSTPYHDGIGLVETLSSEANIPFRFGGKTIAESPHLSRYEPSVEKFDNVLSCLREEARHRQKPSLGDFDWARIDTDQDAEVCLFRVATSYSTIDDLENWMRSQGLRVGRRLLGRVDALDGREAILNAYWPIKEKGPLYRANMVQGWLNGLTAHGQSVTVTYREGLGVVSTRFSVTRK